MTATATTTTITIDKFALPTGNRVTVNSNFVARITLSHNVRLHVDLASGRAVAELPYGDELWGEVKPVRTGSIRAIAHAMVSAAIAAYGHEILAEIKNAEVMYS